jgi:peptide/nickel transport system substrate-binding protein
MSTNKGEALDNKLVRQAMAHAIDRKTVNELVVPATAHPSDPTGHRSPLHVDLTKKFPYDRRAKELLAKAGYPNGFEATIKLPPSSYAHKAGEVTPTCWARSVSS